MLGMTGLECGSASSRRGIEQGGSSATALQGLWQHDMRWPFHLRSANALSFDGGGQGATPALGDDHPCQNEGETQNFLSAQMFTGNNQ